MAPSLQSVPAAPVRGRKLPQYLIVYFGSCAGFLQLFDITIDRLHLPERYFTIGFIVCLLVVPVVVAAALLRELAARDATGRAARRGSHRGIVSWAAIITFLLLAAIAAPRAAAHWATDDSIRLRRGGAVLIAPVSSRTADASLAQVLTDALTIDFEGDASVMLVDETRLRHALALDGIDVRAPNREHIERYAGSSGASAVLDASVERAGGSYVLLARLLTVTGERITSTREVADTPEALWAALDRVSTLMRRAASLVPRSETNGGVPSAAPAALATYAGALRELRAGNLAAAESALRDVVAADSTFVPALRTLGELAYMRGDSATGRPLLAAARDRAETAATRERYLALAAYYQFVEADAARAAVSYRRVLEANPADSLARARLSVLRSATGN